MLYISWWSVFLGGRKPEKPPICRKSLTNFIGETTDLSQVPDKLYRRNHRSVASPWQTLSEKPPICPKSLTNFIGETTDLSQVPDKLYRIMLYRMVIGTDCRGRYESTIIRSWPLGHHNMIRLCWLDGVRYVLVSTRFMFAHVKTIYPVNLKSNLMPMY